MPGSPVLSTLMDLVMCIRKRSWRRLDFFSKIEIYLFRISREIWKGEQGKQKKEKVRLREGYKTMHGPGTKTANLHLKSKCKGF